MFQRLIDAHSHIGQDRFWSITATLTQYLDNAKAIGVTDSILMPTTCPVLSIGDEKVTQLLWEVSGNTFSFYEEVIGKSKKLIYSNPYLKVNMLLEQELLQRRNEGINLYFVPLIHPLLDDLDYLDELLNKEPVAIKIHGIATGISPSEISNEFWKVINKHDIPIIIHTDYDISGLATPLTRLRNCNTPLSWINILQLHNVRAYLAHGLRLCPESCKKVNESDNFLVGIGPDSLMSVEKERLFQTTPYLQTLFTMINTHKLAFDIDYCWNVADGQLDFDSIQRIQTLNLSTFDFERVLWKNAQSFFRL